MLSGRSEEDCEYSRQKEKRAVHKDGSFESLGERKCRKGRNW